jgi:hypothetical protein
MFRRSVSQSALDGLAQLRNEGISELYATKKPVDDGAFAQWKSPYQEWTKRLLAFVKADFPQADFLSLEYLGVLEGRAFSGVYNDEHNDLKGHLAKRIEIVEQILASYRG